MALHVAPGTINIYAKVKSKNYVIIVSEGDTVIKIKKYIKKEFGIKIKNQTIYADDKILKKTRKIGRLHG